VGAPRVEKRAGQFQILKKQTKSILKSQTVTK
jgi:hypothetical protein